MFGNDADRYIAAAGHYGNKSSDLVRHYAQDLGYKYLSASNKEEFISNIEEFVNPAISESIVFEVFTDSVDESEALKKVYNTVVDKKVMFKTKVRSILGEKLSDTIKKIVQ